MITDESATLDDHRSAVALIRAWMNGDELGFATIACNADGGLVPALLDAYEQLARQHFPDPNAYLDLVAERLTQLEIEQSN